MENYDGLQASYPWVLRWLAWSLQLSSFRCMRGQGYNGSPNGEHGEKHMNFWCTIWHNLMGFKFDFSLFPILHRECRDGNSRGWHFCTWMWFGLCPAVPGDFRIEITRWGGTCLWSQVSMWWGLILNWYPSPQRWATSYPWVSTPWDRHRDIFANMPLPGFKWLASAEAWPGRQKFSAVDLTVPNGQGSMKGSPESPGKPLMPGWQMELCFCFAFQRWWKKNMCRSWEFPDEFFVKFQRPAVLVIGGAWQQVVHDVTRPATDCREYSLGTLLTTLDALKKTTMEPTWLQMALRWEYGHMHPFWN